VSALTEREPAGELLQADRAAAPRTR